MLSDDRFHGNLEAIDMSWRSQTGLRSDPVAKQVIAAEYLVDGDGVCVEIKQPAAPLDGSRQVPKVAQLQGTGHFALTGAKVNSAVAMGQAQRP